MAIASAGEAEHHLAHGAGVGVVAPESAERLQDELRQIQRMLVALAARVRSDYRRPPDPDSDD
jgi:hypothetical protein